jgi:hypothetical protein
MKFDEDSFQWLAIIFLYIESIIWGFSVHRRQNNLEQEWWLFLDNRKELYAKLADPLRIEQDLERSAQLREMHDAGRTTLPRENAGPPAVVYRPPLRGVKPGSWRSRNPGNPLR